MKRATKEKISGVIESVLLFIMPFPLFQVVGDSMFPTYQNGEVLWGTKFFKKSSLKIGDVVVYKAPTEDSEIVIKRIAHIKGNVLGEMFLYCVGDNEDVSYDSRYYGYVPVDRVLFKPLDQREKSGSR